MVNIPMSSEARLRHFTCDYFSALGAKVDDENDLLRVELEPDQHAELEGRSGPRMSYWGMQEEDITVLYLAFSSDAAQASPQAELVVPGSHRLEQMLASARRQGCLGLFTMLPRGQAAPSDELYVPYLLLGFRIAFHGQQKAEQLVTACVNLTDGSMHPEIARRAESWILTEKMPDRSAERVLSFSDAWQVACNDVVDYLRRQDDGWAREALIALAHEKRFLEQFYSDQSEINDSLAAERRERLAEADRRSRPRAIARATLGVVLLVPKLPTNDGLAMFH